MTIGWAIVVVAILYLVDKHKLWKKALQCAALVFTLSVLAYSVFIGYQWAKERWEEHERAMRYECFDLSSRKVHPVNESGPYCDLSKEELHVRDTPLPLDGHSAPIPQEPVTGEAAPDIFRWPSDGLPAYIVGALRTPDLAPDSAGLRRTIRLSTSSHAQVISTGSAGQLCGSGGCAWTVTDSSTQRDLIRGEIGALHRLQTITDGYFDLLVEGKDALTVYRYSGDTYHSRDCYVRSDGLGSPAMPTSCAKSGEVLSRRFEPSQRIARAPEHE